jgi:hypothetical protein
MINLSESLGRVPGIVVQNRQNYAQDLQITSRGFGARSTFGVRGLRLVTDGIPASFPGRPGPGFALRPGFGAEHRSAARALLRDVRQRLGRRHQRADRAPRAGSHRRPFFRVVQYEQDRT